MIRGVVLVSVSTLLLTSSVGAATAEPDQTHHAALAACSSGPRTLSKPGAHVYPDVGNGGYVSLHTDVHMVYSAPANRFLPGNHVVLTDRATQCLSDFSLDLERSNADTTNGPDLTVQAVTVNGVAASFRFAQPTYPGDPNGPDDPNPLAHQASQVTPVGGPDSNPLPPACSPQLTGDDVNGQNGEPCPANKLVITPADPLPDGKVFRVSVAYTGRPGVHIDGDGSTEDWMPLNNHPSAKPTYDFHDTVTKGRTAIANGRLLSRRAHRPDSRFPHGSTTFHWRSGAPVASYLVENSVGRFDLTSRVGADGVRYYEAQASSLGKARKRANLKVMRQQQDITHFQSMFNGRFPFRTNGVLVGRPSASFEEEMQTMITFAGGQIYLGTFNHENMHQWWGDNVSEASFNLTFFKEGMATVGEFLYGARRAQQKAGGPGTVKGRRAFQKALVDDFNANYASTNLWTAAPSDPTPARLFSGSTTYVRPGTAYLAVRQILGPRGFDHALQRIQHRFGGDSITEPQLEAQFAHFLPNPSPACRMRLGTFFTQWFDTAYPPGGGANRPQLTGPGLHGTGFYGGGCHR